MAVRRTRIIVPNTLNAAQALSVADGHTFAARLQPDQIAIFGLDACRHFEVPFLNTRSETQPFVEHATGSGASATGCPQG